MKRALELEAKVVAKHITRNWRGRPLRSFEMIVDTIGLFRSSLGECPRELRRLPTIRQLGQRAPHGLHLRRSNQSRHRAGIRVRVDTSASACSSAPIARTRRALRDSLNT
jgi:hypothetical protein